MAEASSLKYKKDKKEKGNRTKYQQSNCKKANGEKAKSQNSNRPTWQHNKAQITKKVERLNPKVSKANNRTGQKTKLKKVIS